MSANTSKPIALLIALAILLALVLPPHADAFGQPHDLARQATPPFHMFFPSVGHDPVETASFGYGVRPLSSDSSTAIGHVQSLGLGWVAFTVPWKNIEPQPGQYSWASVDPLVNAYSAAGIRTLLTISEAPDWARPADDDKTVEGMPEDPATYAAFVSQVAGRYAGKVHALEVWSEQNIYYEVGGVGRINPAFYARLLRSAYQAIKSANPQMLVVTGGLVPTGAPMPYAMDDIEYLGQLYDNGIRGYFDAVGAHPGGYNCPALADWRTVTDPTATFQAPFTVRHHSWCFLGTVEGYRSVMVAHGDTGKQMAVTRFGWASRSNAANPYTYAADNTYAEQAQWIVQAYQWGKASGWVSLMMLDNLDAGLSMPLTNPVTYWSLLLPSGPVPAYSAIAAMPK